MFIVSEYAEAMKAGQPFPPLDTVFDGENHWLWDGWHRLKAAEQAGIETATVNTTEGTLEDAKWLAAGANKMHGFKRSNADKRRAVLLAFEHPRTKAVINGNGGRPNFSEIANHCGVSDRFVGNLWRESCPETELSEITEKSNHSTFQSVVKTRHSPTEKIAPELFSTIRDETDLLENKTEIVRLSRLEPEAQQAVVERLISGESKSVKAASRKIQIEQQITAIESLPPPAGQYNVIVADPPWPYEKRVADPTHRGASPYPDMTIEEIAALDIPSLTYDDCILWLWTTNAFMEQAHQIARAWGFEVKTILTWVKDRIGTGDWLRGQTEHCLLCVKGKTIVNLTNESTVLHGRLREHSRKPDEFYQLVDRLCVGKKLDYFSREQREGWLSYGSESDKFSGR